jgi:Lrp/AsnC family leucine-responsive transcriptional regulator
VDPAVVGQSLLAFIFVQADERPGGESLGSRLAALPEAQEVHHIAGEDCYLVKVRCASTEALGRLLREKLGALEPVRRSRTVVVLGTVKESPELSLPRSLAEVGLGPA